MDVESAVILGIKCYVSPIKRVPIYSTRINDWWSMGSADLSSKSFYSYNL